MTEICIYQNIRVFVSVSIGAMKILKGVLDAVLPGGQESLAHKFVLLYFLSLKTVNSRLVSI